MTKNNNKLSCYEPLPNEPKYLFARFIIYRDLGPARTYSKAVEKIKNQTESYFYEKNKNVTINALMKNAEKWFYTARCELYDADQLLQEIQDNKEKHHEINQILIVNFEAIIKYCNNLIKEIIDGPKKSNGENYSIMSIIKMLHDVTLILKNANEQLRLCCGLSTTNNDVNLEGLLDVKGLIDVNAEVIDNTSTIDEIKEIDKELAELYEPTNRTHD